jgi:hypothetical protein
MYPPDADSQSEDEYCSRKDAKIAKKKCGTAAPGCSLVNIYGGPGPPYTLDVFAKLWFLLIAKS